MPGPYTLGEKLYEGKARLVHRAEDARSGRKVIVKLLRPEAAGADDLRRIRHERDMLVDIAHPSVARLLDYGEEGIGAWLVIEDIGGESITRRLAALGQARPASGGAAPGRLPLREALAVAAGVARALGAVHARDIVHKDVGPNNVAVAPDGRVQLFDFDTAARLPRSGAGLPPSGRLEGTLPYLSPEQTGRASLPLDERSDLYSLGAMLHELLTGGPPFRGDDALEIVHAHLALRPAPPHEVDPAIPEVVSAIAQRLLEKAPEDRYQSAFGVERDLMECIAALDAGAPMPALPPARRSLPARLHLPERIYGRERAAEQLVAAFEACREGRPQVAVVAGPPGVGKSALLRVLARHVASAQGFVGAGKLEAESPLAPCAALIEPLRALAAQVFAAGEAEVAALSARVAQTIGAARGTLLGLVPDLALVLGGRAHGAAEGGARSGADHPAGARVLTPEGARLLFTELFRALARPERPVALVLDDVQWADAASLDLIGALAREPDIRGLCIVVTARPKALEAGEPLAALLAALGRAHPGAPRSSRPDSVPPSRARVPPSTDARSRLGPAQPDGSPPSRARVPPSARPAEGPAPIVLSLPALDPDALDALLADTLALPPREARGLGALLARKTNGNPLSIRLFLAAIYRDGLLSFDAAAGRWTWDAAGVEALPVADNVVALLAERTAALGESVRRALGIAACLGGRFDAATVAAVGGVPEPEAAAQLDAAAREGLLVGAERGLRFAHDRVLEAAYGAVPAEEMRALHAAACRALRATLDRPEEDVRLFDVLRHADAAGDAFGEEERFALARLGLLAGRRARASAALDTALAHLRAALSRLPPSAWSRAHGLAYELHHLAAECSYSSQQIDEGERLFRVLLQRAPDDRARARAYGMHAVQIPPGRRDAAGFEEIRRGLALLGVQLPRRATLPVVLLELAKARRIVRGRSAAELAALPPLSDPRIAATLDVIDAGLGYSYYHDRKMYVVLALRGAALAARHGHGRHSPGLFALYAMVVGASLGDLDRMKELGQLALSLADRYPDAYSASIARMINGAYIQPYRDHMRTALPHFLEGQRLATLAGAGKFTGLCALGAALCCFFGGWPLEEARAQCGVQLRVASRAHAREHEGCIAVVRQLILALEGATIAPGSLDTDDFDLAHHLAEIRRDAPQVIHLTLDYLLALDHLHFDRPHEALALLEESAAVAEREWVGLVQLGEHHFFRALALSALAAGDDLGRLDREKLLLKLRLAARKLAGWAGRSPHNFTHRHALVAAELAGLTGDADTAIRRYEEAIQGAQKGGFLQDAGLATERAAQFFLRRKLVDVGVSYLAAARRTYLRWGAHGKVALLEQRLPGLAARDHTSHPGTLPEGTAASDARSMQEGTATGTTRAGVGLLDAPSLLKATQALSSERTMERLFARIMEIVAESAGAERAALLLVGEGSAAGEGSARIELHAEVAAGRRPVLHAEPRPLEELTALPAGIVRWVVRRGEPMLLADAAAEGPFTREPSVLARGSRSILAMPLQWKGDVLGVLLLENDLVRGAFTEARASLLATLCVQLAISVQNARHYAELERRVDERTRALREAQSRIVALEKDATEAQMAGGFAHEMRNALSGARMLLRLAIGSARLPEGGLIEQVERRIDDLEAKLSDEGRAAIDDDVRALRDVRADLDDVVKRVDEAIARGLHITNDVLAYAALRGEAPGETPVRLRPLVEEVARELRGPGVAIDVAVPPDLTLRAKPEHLRTILENITRNACEAIGEQAPGRGGRVRIDAAAAPSGVTVRVEDNGAGMSPEVQARVFEPFFSTKPSSGLGLGLGVVRKLVLLYEGRLQVDSVVGRGTVIAITLPARASPMETGLQVTAG